MPKVKTVPRPPGIREIYTAGYPRSGNTWLNRLLSDLLSSPLQTLPGEPMEHFGHVGGHFVIRKTHCRAWEVEERQIDPDAQWVFIQRDPRDVAVSRYFYAGIPTMREAIEGMFNPLAEYYEYTFHEQGNYEAFIRSWIDSGKADVETKYELLQFDPVPELQRIVTILRGGPMPVSIIKEKINRQSFQEVQKRYGDRFGHSMRAGVSGDYRNWMSRKDGELIQEGLGQLMQDMGYESDPDWWKELPKLARRRK